MSNDALVILLAEDPIPGRLRSSVAAVVGEARAAVLHAAFAADAISAARGTDGCDTVVALPHGSTGAWLDRRPEEGSVARWHQPPGDFSARLRHSLAEAAELGYERCGVFLTLTPSLTREWLERALAALADHDIVIASDGVGGLAFLGVRGVAPDQLFEEIPFGKPGAFHRTETRLWVLDRTFCAVPALSAVRTRQDVDQLRARLVELPDDQRPAATAAALEL